MIMGNVALILTTFTIVVLITISISCMCNIFIFKGDLKMKVKEVYSYCLHFVSLAFSTISIVLCCPRVIDKGNLGFDYIGVIVGILSLLVAVLIGWQIYKTIDMEKRINEANSYVRRETEKVKYLIDGSANQLYAIQLMRKEDGGDENKDAISHFMYALDQFIKSEDKESIKGVISFIKYMRDEEFRVSKFSKEESESYIKILIETKNFEAKKLIDYIRSKEEKS